MIIVVVFVAYKINDGKEKKRKKNERKEIEAFRLC